MGLCLPSSLLKEGFPLWHESQIHYPLVRVSELEVGAQWFIGAGMIKNDRNKNESDFHNKSTSECLNVFCAQM